MHTTIAVRNKRYIRAIERASFHRKGTITSSSPRSHCTEYQLSQSCHVSCVPGRDHKQSILESCEPCAPVSPEVKLITSVCIRASSGQTRCQSRGAGSGAATDTLWLAGRLVPIYNNASFTTGCGAGAPMAATKSACIAVRRGEPRGVRHL